MSNIWRIWDHHHKLAMLLLFVMIGISALVVEMGEPTGTKAVRVGLLKDVQPLLPEFGGVVLQAGLLTVSEVGVPVRPVLDICKTFEEVPGITWVSLLQLVPGLLVLPEFLVILFLLATLLKPQVYDTMRLDRIGGKGDVWRRGEAGGSCWRREGRG